MLKYTRRKKSHHSPYIYTYVYIYKQNPNLFKAFSVHHMISCKVLFFRKLVISYYKQRNVNSRCTYGAFLTLSKNSTAFKPNHQTRKQIKSLP